MWTFEGDMAFQVLQSYHRHPYLSTPLRSGTLTVSFFTHLGEKTAPHLPRHGIRVMQNVHCLQNIH